MTVTKTMTNTIQLQDQFQPALAVGETVASFCHTVHIKVHNDKDEDKDKDKDNDKDKITSNQQPEEKLLPPYVTLLHRAHHKTKRQ